MREIAKDPEIDLKVYFCFDHGVRRRRDPELGVAYTWDVPLLEGYEYKFLKNWSPWASTAPIRGVFNPGIWHTIRGGGFDAFLVHGYVSPTVWLAVASAKARGTAVFLRGESTLLYPRSKAMMTLKRVALSVLFKKVNIFLTVGSRNAEFYRAYGVEDERMVLTPYCVDNEFFFNARKADTEMGSRTRRELGIEPADPVILFVGKLIERKRPADLLRAYELILKTHPRATLMLVGDGTQYNDLVAETKRQELNRVHFVGFKNRTEIRSYYACADIFVLPSIHDPWGLVINEAMCFSLPIVASNLVGAVGDIVREGENGFSFPAGDVEKLAGCLKRLLDDSALRCRMGVRSEQIIRKWSYAECVAGVKMALQRTVGSRVPVRLGTTHE
jgi:glycosyltransferase involved in cell wall biosynthesis